MHLIQWTEFSKQDYEELDGSQKVFVDKAIDRLKIQGMNAGQTLHGALSSCKKLKNKRIGLRIVFREISGSIQIIQIVAIGKRDKDEVYRIAETRVKNKKDRKR